MRAENFRKFWKFTLFPAFQSEFRVKNEFSNIFENCRFLYNSYPKVFSREQILIGPSLDRSKCFVLDWCFYTTPVIFQKFYDNVNFLHLLLYIYKKTLHVFMCIFFFL